MTDPKSILSNLWSAACRDEPQRDSCRVEDGFFIFTVRGNRDQWANLCAASGVPSDAEQRIDGDTLTCRWPSHADTIFGPDGLIAQKLPDYEMRTGQLHMARMVQRAIEMKCPAVIEAATGTGKSYSYAAICMAMGKRVAIATSNKALQAQLYAKDIPFLQSLFPGKKLALVQGKQNYACHAKAQDVSAGAYTVGGELLNWYLGTESGNTEEIPFAVEYEELSKLTADSYCTGKRCTFYDECFYYKAKAARAEADVLILNHMLLAMHQLYPAAAILPPVDVIVIDEAHQYAGYVQNATGIELATTTIKNRLRVLDDDPDVDDRAQKFFAALAAHVGNSTDKEIAVAHDITVETGTRLADALFEAAEELWYEGEMPESDTEHRRKVDADRVRAVADAIRTWSVPTRDGFVRWIENKDGTLSLRHVPHSVAEQIAQLAGFHTEQAATVDFTRCARCGRTLTAATVNILDGLPYGPDCIRHVDLLGDAELVPLETWLDEVETREPITVQKTPTPVIFTSATLATPTLDTFRREAGLPYALELVADSPFDYVHNALLYVPDAAETPPPNNPEYRDYLVEEMARLVHAAGGGAFCLFTSYADMHYVSQRLRWEFEQRGYEVFVQGLLPKLEIVKRFKATDRGVLFATKSFWEGVSIDGESLRLVVISKMPFEAPSPLNQAQEAALTQWARTQGMTDKQASWYPFENLRVPRMILDLKQGTGRLIRTQSDWGVMAILDARLRSAQYARRLVLPALPPAHLTSNFYEVSDFYRNRAKRQAEKRTLAELAPLQQGKAVLNPESLADVAELPF